LNNRLKNEKKNCKFEIFEDRSIGS